VLARVGDARAAPGIALDADRNPRLTAATGLVVGLGRAHRRATAVEVAAGMAILRIEVENARASVTPRCLEEKSHRRHGRYALSRGDVADQ